MRGPGVVLAALVTVAAAATAPPSAAQPAADRCAEAPVSDASTATIDEALVAPGDIDWYRFKIVGPAGGPSRLVRIVLGRLPANYRIDVYDDCGERLTGSDRAGRQYEDLFVQSEPGVLAVRVSSRKDASSTRPYQLHYDAYGPGIVVSRLLLRARDGRLTVGTQIINNTGTSRRNVVVRLRHAQRCGSGCADPDGPVDTVRIRRLAPNQVLPVALHRATPPRYAGTRVTVASWQTDAGLEVRPLPVWVPTTTVRDGERVHGGVVENPTGGRVHDVRVTVASFDDRGRVLDAATVKVADDMSTADRVAFEIRRPLTGGATRHRVTADGVR
jgi:hypothetical protein